MEQAPKESGHNTEFARIQEVSGECFQMYGLIFE